MSLTKELPECWGHRGASARFPENTLASFEAAIRDGAHGIESDVHITKDNVIVMFHDPTLDRTTDGTGKIKDQNWYGEIEHVRTKKEPKQAIPTFIETVALLMKPENRHAKFDVDIKITNDPKTLFNLMHDTISAQPNWETDLAPRIVLGLWHPRFLEPAKALLPYCSLSHIGLSPWFARRYFWKDCEIFSMNFGAMATIEGWWFRRRCKAAGKKVVVWTVNEPRYMIEATRWGVHAIITDVTNTWLDLRKKLEGGGKDVRSLWLWTQISLWLYSPLWFLRTRLIEWRIRMTPSMAHDLPK